MGPHEFWLLDKKNKLLSQYFRFEYVPSYIHVCRFALYIFIATEYDYIRTSHSYFSFPFEAHFGLYIIFYFICYWTYIFIFVFVA